jgi:hypothetical protein
MGAVGWFAEMRAVVNPMPFPDGPRYRFLQRDRWVFRIPRRRNLAAAPTPLCLYVSGEDQDHDDDDDDPDKARRTIAP